MKHFLLVLSAFVLLAQDTGHISSVEPEEGKTGDAVTATGTFLDPAHVDVLYLTDGTKDTKVVMVERTATSIKFKIPSIAVGRYALMISTKEKQPRLIEQPVKLNVL